MAMYSSERTTVLIVEDVAAMRMFLRTMLEDKDIQIVDAGSVREARELLCGEQRIVPDCVLLDLELPDGNGLEIMPDVPLSSRVFALTADVSHDIEYQCRIAGCEQVLEKNYGLSSLWPLVSGREGVRSKSDARFVADSGSYVEFLTEVLDTLIEAKTRSDFQAIRQIAHRLHGTAVHFGYPDIGAAAKFVSATFSAGQLGHCETATSSLVARLHDVINPGMSRQGRAADGLGMDH